MVSLISARRACYFILLFAAISFSYSAISAQSQKFERSFSTGDKPKIVVSNGSSISIAPWNKNEVLIAAEASGAALQDKEVRIKPNKSGLEVSVHPVKSGKTISLTLRVPPNSVFEIKAHGTKIEVKQPVAPVNIIASESHIHLDVPGNASLDMRDVERAMKYQQTQYVINGFGIERRLIGQGPPYLKVGSTKALVLVGRASIRRFMRPLTRTARAIARKNNSMSRALRKSYLKDDFANSEDRDLIGASDADENEGEAIKLETHLVNLNVSVTDRDGKVIPGLDQNDFSIYEDGVLQRISFFSPDQTPFNLILLIDLSGSVRNKIDLIRETALHFLDVISPQDSVGVITFSADVTVVSRLTRDREELRERINDMRTPTGGTSFYDALGYVLSEELSGAKGQRNAIIAITDGLDNSIQDSLMSARRPPALRSFAPRTGSFLTFDQLLEGAMEAEALIYPIYLKNTDTSLTASSPSRNPSSRERAEFESKAVETADRQMRELALASGARIYRAERIEDLKGVFEQVAEELRTIYSMAYSPTNLNFDGNFRRIRVQVNKPDAALRARRGYYAK